ncbi:MAG: homoserine dehydrogenase [Oligosphaeraceae bacterium]|nr:homoserine dehydrogenase [Oligosphaeraceae bacterium]
MKKYNLGIIGFGTVGAGVVETIQKNGELLARRTGVQLAVTRIADLDIVSNRGVSLEPGVLGTDAMALIESPDVDVVVELVGGTTVARKFIAEALQRGKPVVTANKALLATYGEELFALARQHHTEIYFEASVGGGIPCIKALREGLVGNRCQMIYGILNGTCNYILTRMEQEQADFAAVLKSAKDAGYAEANPSMDVDGYDTAHKTAILASLVYGKWFKVDDVEVQGIRAVTLKDIDYAAHLGYRIKLLAVIKEKDGRIQLGVHPSLIPGKSLLGHVDGVYNAVWVRGDVSGTTMYYGRGAGREATSSAVVADIMDIALNHLHGCPNRVPAFPVYPEYQGLMYSDEVVSRYYLRLQVADRPGVLARISGILGHYQISIASVTQHEVKLAAVPMVILTHQAREADMQQALSEISREDCVVQEPVVFHIEDLVTD